MIQRVVKLVHREGLHARPAAVFVQRAKRFEARITVKQGRRRADGKSIMGLLTLAVRPGARLVVEADGPDAAQAVQQLCQVLTKPLPEPSKPPPI